MDNKRKKEVKDFMAINKYFYDNDFDGTLKGRDLRRLIGLEKEQVKILTENGVIGQEDEELYEHELTVEADPELAVEVAGDLDCPF